MAGRRSTAANVRAHLLASAVAAILSPVVIAVAGSVADGARWEQPLGLLNYALLFVFPFTLVGSFAILWPTHRWLNAFVDRSMLPGLIIGLAALVGGAMLCLLSAAWPTFVIGALSGACTAIIWLIAFHLAARARCAA